ncbi:MAG: hypothetical protein EBZ46_08820, partial [Actinobacteria bacterium]|nr:hypothetical protein [Actinomycetota bacterium]
HRGTIGGSIAHADPASDLPATTLALGATYVVQGLAQALYEEAVYDSDGNLKTSNLAEYLVPAACDVPPITTDFTVTPSTTNQLGVKGIGEAGTIGAAPTVMNAVIDALSGLGITQLDMPASPNNVWNAINKARGGKQ